MRHFVPLLILAAFLALPAARPRAEEKATRQRVADLIGQLGSDRYAEREEAAHALDALGPAALPGLRAAARGDDPEVCRRAAELVGIIERRQETARLLQPRRVRLVYDNVPLPEVIADFGRKTGYAIQLAPDAARRLAGRRVTLDTGETTYWEALARLCEAAELREQETRGPTPQEHANVVARGKARRVMVINETASFALSRPVGPLVLEDGKAPTLPTCQVGALRLRALPPQATSADPARGDAEVGLTLEIKVEPSLGWEGLVAVRIERAVDDRGQLLRSTGASEGGNPLTEGAEEVIMVWDGHAPPPTAGAPRPVPLRLRLAEHPSRRLAELRGTLAARVRTPPEPLVTVKDVLKATDKTFEAADGTVLRVTEAKLESDGLYKVQVSVTPPPPTTDVDALGLGVRFVRINRNLPGKVSVSSKEGNCPLTLYDARGRPFRLTTGDFLADGNSQQKSFTLIFQPTEGQGEPARLVYTERRTTLIEVPFVLKNVPLVK
jgi:hypothetical protein